MATLQAKATFLTNNDPAQAACDKFLATMQLRAKGGRAFAEAQCSTPYAVDIVTAALAASYTVTFHTSTGAAVSVLAAHVDDDANVNTPASDDDGVPGVEDPRATLPVAGNVAAYVAAGHTFRVSWV